MRQLSRSSRHGRRSPYLALALAGPMAVAACGETPTSIATTLVFSVDSVVVGEGDTLPPPELALLDQAGQPLAPQLIAWWSDDSAVVEVTSPGNLVGRMPGTARVFAAVAGLAVSIPVTVTVTLTAVDPSPNAVCGISSENHVYCWTDGTNVYAADRTCRVGTPRLGAFPCRPLNAPLMTTVNVGGVTCGVGVDGGGYCWGSNSHGVMLGIGDASVVSTRIPTRLDATPRFQSVSVGLVHACGLSTIGVAYCWGVASEWAYSPRFYSTIGFEPSPIPQHEAVHFESLDVGGNFVCGVTESGTGHCWGNNSFGNLGCGDYGVACTGNGNLTTVSGGLVFQQISAGRMHACGVTRGGALYCWGRNHLGQLGAEGSDECQSRDGPELCAFSPVRVAPDLTFQMVAASEGTDPTSSGNTINDHTCALTETGEAYCWGGGVPEPTPVLGGLRFSTLAVASYRSCGITAAGITYCWGPGPGPMPQPLSFQRP